MLIIYKISNDLIKNLTHKWEKITYALKQNARLNKQIRNIKRTPKFIAICYSTLNILALSFLRDLTSFIKEVSPLTHSTQPWRYYERLGHKFWCTVWFSGSDYPLRWGFAKFCHLPPLTERADVKNRFPSITRLQCISW